MILLLRGHIRNSFDDDRLYLLLKEIQRKDNNLEIYIHTWNIIQSNISWRELDLIETFVTNEIIFDYFRDLKSYVKNILIDNDENIKLIGSVVGNVGNTLCPLIGWKRYWYGKFSLVNFVHNLKHTTEVVALNMRFDILSCSYFLSQEAIITFIENNRQKRFVKNSFISDYETPGIDNIYIGNIATMKKIVDHFYYNLDEIILQEKVIYQEVLVFRENTKLFPQSFQFKMKTRFTR
jgi:hypothetical protein